MDFRFDDNDADYSSDEPLPAVDEAVEPNPSLSSPSSHPISVMKLATIKPPSMQLLAVDREWHVVDGGALLSLTVADIASWDTATLLRRVWPLFDAKTKRTFFTSSSSPLFALPHETPPSRCRPHLIDEFLFKTSKEFMLRGAHGVTPYALRRGAVLLMLKRQVEQAAIASATTADNAITPPDVNGAIEELGKHAGGCAAALLLRLWRASEHPQRLFTDLIDAVCRLCLAEVSGIEPRTVAHDHAEESSSSSSAFPTLFDVLSFTAGHVLHNNNHENTKLMHHVAFSMCKLVRGMVQVWKVAMPHLAKGMGQIRLEQNLTTLFSLFHVLPEIFEREVHIENSDLILLLTQLATTLTDVGAELDHRKIVLTGEQEETYEIKETLQTSVLSQELNGKQTIEIPLHLPYASRIQLQFHFPTERPRAIKYEVVSHTSVAHSIEIPTSSETFDVPPPHTSEPLRIIIQFPPNSRREGDNQCKATVSAVVTACDDAILPRCEWNEDRPDRNGNGNFSIALTELALTVSRSIMAIAGRACEETVTPDLQQTNENDDEVMHLAWRSGLSKKALREGSQCAETVESDSRVLGSSRDVYASYLYLSGAEDARVTELVALLGGSQPPPPSSVTRDVALAAWEAAKKRVHSPQSDDGITFPQTFIALFDRLCSRHEALARSVVAALGWHARFVLDLPFDVELRRVLYWMHLKGYLPQLIEMAQDHSSSGSARIAALTARCTALLEDIVPRLRVDSAIAAVAESEEFCCASSVEFQRSGSNLFSNSSARLERQTSSAYDLIGSPTTTVMMRVPSTRSQRIIAALNDGDETCEDHKKNDGIRVKIGDFLMKERESTVLIESLRRRRNHGEFLKVCTEVLLHVVNVATARRAGEFMVIVREVAVLVVELRGHGLVNRQELRMDIHHHLDAIVGCGHLLMTAAQGKSCELLKKILLHFGNEAKQNPASQHSDEARSEQQSVLLNSLLAAALVAHPWNAVDLSLLPVDVLLTELCRPLSLALSTDVTPFHERRDGLLPHPTTLFFPSGSVPSHQLQHSPIWILPAVFSETTPEQRTAIVTRVDSGYEVQVEPGRECRLRAQTPHPLPRASSNLSNVNRKDRQGADSEIQEQHDGLLRHGVSMLYFEIEMVLLMGANERSFQASIGFSTDHDDFSVSWSQGGEVRCGGSNLSLGEPWADGDVVGIGVVTESRRVFCTLNGRFLGICGTVRESCTALSHVVSAATSSGVMRCSIRFGEAQKPLQFDPRVLLPLSCTAHVSHACAVDAGCLGLFSFGHHLLSIFASISSTDAQVASEQLQCVLSRIKPLFERSLEALCRGVDAEPGLPMESLDRFGTYVSHLLQLIRLLVDCCAAATHAVTESTAIDILMTLMTALLRFEDSFTNESRHHLNRQCHTSSSSTVTQPLVRTYLDLLFVLRHAAQTLSLTSTDPSPWAEDVITKLVRVVTELQLTAADPSRVNTSAKLLLWNAVECIQVLHAHPTFSGFVSSVVCRDITQSNSPTSTVLAALKIAGGGRPDHVKQYKNATATVLQTFGRFSLVLRREAQRAGDSDEIVAVPSDHLTSLFVRPRLFDEVSVSYSAEQVIRVLCNEAAHLVLASTLLRLLNADETQGRCALEAECEAAYQPLERHNGDLQRALFNNAARSGKNALGLEAAPIVFDRSTSSKAVYFPNPSVAMAFPSAVHHEAGSLCVANGSPVVFRDNESAFTFTVRIQNSSHRRGEPVDNIFIGFSLGTLNMCDDMHPTNLDGVYAISPISCFPREPQSVTARSDTFFKNGDIVRVSLRVRAVDGDVCRCDLQFDTLGDDGVVPIATMEVASSVNRETFGRDCLATNLVPFVAMRGEMACVLLLDDNKHFPPRYPHVPQAALLAQLQETPRLCANCAVALDAVMSYYGRRASCGATCVLLCTSCFEAWHDPMHPYAVLGNTSLLASPHPPSSSCLQVGDVVQIEPSVAVQWSVDQCRNVIVPGNNGGRSPATATTAVVQGTVSYLESIDVCTLSDWRVDLDIAVTPSSPPASISLGFVDSQQTHTLELLDACHDRWWNPTMSPRTLTVVRSADAPSSVLVLLDGVVVKRACAEPLMKFLNVRFFVKCNGAVGAVLRFVAPLFGKVERATVVELKSCDHMIVALPNLQHRLVRRQDVRCCLPSLSVNETPSCSVPTSVVVLVDDDVGMYRATLRRVDPVLGCVVVIHEQHDREVALHTPSTHVFVVGDRAEDTNGIEVAPLASYSSSFPSIPARRQLLCGANPDVHVSNTSPHVGVMLDCCCDRKSISILQLSFKSRATEELRIMVQFKEGSTDGHEGSMDSWTQVAEAKVVPDENRMVRISLSKPLFIDRNSTFALLILTDSPDGVELLYESEMRPFHFDSDDCLYVTMSTSIRDPVSETAPSNRTTQIFCGSIEYAVVAVPNATHCCPAPMNDVSDAPPSSTSIICGSLTSDPTCMNLSIKEAFLLSRLMLCLQAAAFSRNSQLRSLLKAIRKWVTSLAIAKGDMDSVVCTYDTIDPVESFVSDYEAQILREDAVEKIVTFPVPLDNNVLRGPGGATTTTAETGHPAWIAAPWHLITTEAVIGTVGNTHQVTVTRHSKRIPPLRKKTPSSLEECLKAHIALSARSLVAAVMFRDELPQPPVALKLLASLHQDHACQVASTCLNELSAEAVTPLLQEMLFVLHSASAAADRTVLERVLALLLQALRSRAQWIKPLLQSVPAMIGTCFAMLRIAVVQSRATRHTALRCVNEILLLPAAVSTASAAPLSTVAHVLAASEPLFTLFREALQPMLAMLHGLIMNRKRRVPATTSMYDNALVQLGVSLTATIAIQLASVTPRASSVPGFGSAIPFAPVVVANLVLQSLKGAGQPLPPALSLLATPHRLTTQECRDTSDTAVFAKRLVCAELFPCPIGSRSFEVWIPEIRLSSVIIGWDCTHGGARIQSSSGVIATEEAVASLPYASQLPACALIIDSDGTLMEAVSGDASLRRVESLVASKALVVCVTCDYEAATVKIALHIDHGPEAEVSKDPAQIIEYRLADDASFTLPFFACTFRVDDAALVLSRDKLKLRHGGSTLQEPIDGGQDKFKWLMPAMFRQRRLQAQQTTPSSYWYDFFTQLRQWLETCPQDFQSKLISASRALDETLHQVKACDVVSFPILENVLQQHHLEHCPRETQTYNLTPMYPFIVQLAVFDTLAHEYAGVHINKFQCSDATWTTWDALQPLVSKQTRERIFATLWNQVSSQIRNGGGGVADVTIHTMWAAPSSKRGDTATLSNSVFGQLHQQLCSRPPQQLLHSPMFKVKLAGFAAQDAGGPYREVLTLLADEIMATHPSGEFQMNPLFQAVSSEVGAAVMPNTTIAWSSQISSMYEFFGRLLAAFLLSTSEVLAVDLPCLFWKMLLKHSVAPQDLIAMDKSYAWAKQPQLDMETLEELDDTQLPGVLDAWRAASRTAQPAGATNEVGTAMAAVALSFAVTRFEPTMQCIRNGMCQIVPLHVLQGLYWSDVEERICGAPTITVEALKSQCKITDLPRTLVTMFWSVVDSFTPVDRAMLLRFATGQSRLPLKSPLVVELRGDGRDSLPTSATCFFTLKLPMYSSQEIMRDRVLYAIRQCNAIDRDGNAHEDILVSY